MGLEGLCAGEGDVTGSPGEREGAEGVSGAGRGAEEGEEGLGSGVGLPAAGLEADGDGLLAADVNGLTGLGAVGGPRGFGDTGGGGRCLGSVQTKNITFLLLFYGTFVCERLCWFYSQYVSVRGQPCTSHLGSVPSQSSQGRVWGLCGTALEGQSSSG